MVLKQQDMHMQKNKICCFLTYHAQKWPQNGSQTYLNVRSKVIKLLKENKEVYLHDFGVDKAFMYLIPKAKVPEEKKEKKR